MPEPGPSRSSLDRASALWWLLSGLVLLVLAASLAVREAWPAALGVGMAGAFALGVGLERRVLRPRRSLRQRSPVRGSRRQHAQENLDDLEAMVDELEADFGGGETRPATPRVIDD